MELFFSKKIIDSVIYKDNKIMIYKKYESLLDSYLTIISIECSFLSITHLIYYGINDLFFLFLILTVISSSIIFFDFKLKKRFHFLYLISISFTLFFICLHSKLELGYFIYFITIFPAVPLVINPNDNIKQVVIINTLLFLMILLIVINYGNNQAFQKLFSNQINPVLRINIIINLINLIIFKILYIKRQNIYLDIIELNKNVQDGLHINRSPINPDYDKLLELKKIAETTPNFFFQNFVSIYPSFIEKLKDSNNDLIISELEICAYLFLNYNTKDIARYTKCSIRSVESKKFRIRKKLSLQTDVNLNEFLIKLV